MTSNQDTQPHAVLDDATLDKLGAAAGLALLV